MRIDVPGYPGWQADTDGRVYRDGVEKGTTYRGNGDRVFVVANGRSKTRAYIVCTAFHGPQPPDKRCAAHRNDAKADDRPENLYWATDVENHADAIRNGTKRRYYGNGSGGRR